MNLKHCPNVEQFKKHYNKSADKNKPIKDKIVL